MNAPVIHRDILKLHVAAVEAMRPLRFLGLLPRGTVGHVDVKDESALEFLADKSEGLSLMDLCGAEIELGRSLGRNVGIILRSGLRDAEIETIPALAEPTRAVR